MRRNPQQPRTPRPNIWKVLFGFAGLAALLFLVSEYGLTTISEQLSRLGWRIPLLILTFVPTLLCYSIAWLLVTQMPRKPGFGQLLKTTLLFARMSSSSIAWNNLTPFLKIGGEPLKVFMLDSFVGRRSALRSVVVYITVHIVGTMGSLVVAAALLPVLFHPGKTLGTIFLVVAAVVLAVTFLTIRAPSSLARLSQRFSRGRARRTFVNIRWSLRAIAKSFRSNKLRLSVAVALEIAARFLEGLTLYFSFKLMGSPISLLTAAFLDVGRMIIDTAFFFIPFQVGTREGGIYLLMKDVFGIPVTGYVTASLLYRFVEITWMIIGYSLWVLLRSSAKSGRRWSKTPSAEEAP